MDKKPENDQLFLKTYKITLEPIDQCAREILEDIRRDYRLALKKSEKYLEEETRRFGGNSFLEESLQDKYFAKIE